MTVRKWTFQGRYDDSAPWSQTGTQAPAILLLCHPTCCSCGLRCPDTMSTFQVGRWREGMSLSKAWGPPRNLARTVAWPYLAARKSGECNLCSHHVPNKKLGDRYQSLPHSYHLWALKNIRRFKWVWLLYAGHQPLSLAAGRKTGPVGRSPGWAFKSWKSDLTGNLPMLAKYDRKQKASLFDSKPVSSQARPASALSSPLLTPFLCSLGIPAKKPEFLV